MKPSGNVLGKVYALLLYLEINYADVVTLW